jgi:Thermopsin/Periplasmic copper-binding protein (NosD)
MSFRASAPKGVWILPIVVLLCVLVVLPAGTFTQSQVPSHSGTTTAASSQLSSASATAGALSIAHSALPGNRFANGAVPTVPASRPSALPGQASAATSSIEKSIQQLEAKHANPSTIRMLQGIAAGIASGAIDPRTVYLPSFTLLADPASSPSQAVSPYYTASPAPMGIGDFGLGTSVYTLNTSAIVGTATFSSYNATAGSLYQDTGQYYWNGFPASEPGNPYDSGLQLNTVLANVTFPGYLSTPLGSGVFWTQNVPDINGNTISFIDNVWNFSASGATMNPGTLYSYDGVLVPYDFYYAYGPTLPLAYPVTIQLYNNASVVNGRDVLTYGYRVVEPSHVYTGIYDTVTFNSPSGSTSGLPPQFRINGRSTAPNGGFFDSELVFCGPGAGSNAVISNVSGSLSMAYQKSPGVWVAPTSAYDYGTNTGETAIGVASTWAGTTVSVTQGPSLLYGLWGTTNGVPSGSIQFVGHTSPIYAFTFIGELSGVNIVNPAWAPSDAAGTVSTSLPPSLPSPYSAYGLIAMGDEYHPLQTSFSGSHSNFAITLTTAPGTLDAPLYMNGEAQATALITAITGGSTSPYTFKNLVLNVDPYWSIGTFNLLNDWEFPTFNLVFSTGLTTPIVINNVAQGPNSGLDTEYYWPYFGGAYYNLPNASQQFVDYGGVGDQFMNLNLPCFFAPIGLCLGGAISLWNTNGVTVTNITATGGSWGVWASTTTATTVKDSSGNDSEAFTVVASSGAVGWNLSATNFGAAVYDFGGSDGTFSYLNSSYYGAAYGAFWANGTTLDHVRSTGTFEAAVVQGGSGLTANDLWVNASGEGLIGEFVSNASVNGGSYWNGTGPGVGFLQSSALTISNQYANDSFAVGLASDTSANVSGVTATNDSLGVSIDPSSQVTVANTNATGRSVGVEAIDSSNIVVTGANASDVAIGAIFAIDTNVSVTNSAVSDLAIAVIAEANTQLSISGVTAWNATLTGLYSALHIFGDPFAAIDSFGNTMFTVANVNATSYGAAVWDFGSNGASVSSVNATGGQFAVVLNDTVNSLFSGINAYMDWQGMLLQDSAAANTVTASSFIGDSSYGVVLNGASGNVVWDNNFIDNNGATSVYSAAHIQAWSNEPNQFNSCSNPACSSGVGNYWADWHTYGPNGYLAPYPITGAVWDYFPIGPAETFTVTFTESGIEFTAGSTWSVTLGGVTEYSNSPTITFAAPMGTSLYSVGSFAGYTASPSSGSVIVTGASYNVSITFTPVRYAVTLSEGGLSPSTTWSATVDGVTQSSSGTSIVFYLNNGTHSFSFNAVSGYNLGSGASGTLSVPGAPVSLSATYSPVSTPSLASTSDLNNYFAIALAIALIALVVALVALLLRRGGKKAEPMPPPAAWTPPTAAGGAGTAEAPAPASSGGPSWSEGTGPGGSGGSPPPS